MGLKIAFFFFNCIPGLRAACFILPVFPARMWTRNILLQILHGLAMVCAISVLSVLFYFVLYSISVIRN